MVLATVSRANKQKDAACRLCDAALAQRTATGGGGLEDCGWAFRNDRFWGMVDGGFAGRALRCHWSA